jgi:antitoxin MazE
MKTRIVAIGNSQGIRIPKPLLEQCGLSGEVEISAEDGALVIRPVKGRRANWAAAFQEMARRGDDALLDEVAPEPVRFKPSGHGNIPDEMNHHLRTVIIAPLTRVHFSFCRFRRAREVLWGGE